MAAKPCVFCSIVTGATAADLVLEQPEVLAFLDHRPVFKGHTLVLPRRHVETLPDLPDDLLGPLFAAARALSIAIPAAMDGHGSFVAINNVISQSVPHLHVHVVPRRRGDGLRGFFWPRTRYDDDAEQRDVAARIRAALGALGG